MAIKFWHHLPICHDDDVDNHDYDRYHDRHDDVGGDGDYSGDANVCERDSCGSLGVAPLNVILSLNSKQ